MVVWIVAVLEHQLNTFVLGDSIETSSLRQVKLKYHRGFTAACVSLMAPYQAYPMLYNQVAAQHHVQYARSKTLSARQDI